MNINGNVPFLINILDTIMKGLNILIKQYTASSGLPSSRRWRVLHFVNVIKVSIRYQTTVLVISHSVTFLLNYCGL